MLSRAQEAALFKIKEAEDTLIDYIKAHTRSLFPKKEDHLLRQVIYKLDRIRSQYNEAELREDRFRKALRRAYDLLMRRKRYDEAAGLAKKYNF